MTIEQTKSNTNTKYRPEIDGLRAFSVIAVIINHFNKVILPGGYLGVDIFFVISGYVITSSIFKRQSKDFKDFISGFYERRIKRLVPGLAVFVFICSFVICLFNQNPGSSLKTGIFSLFGLSNFYLFKSSTDYFAQSTELNIFTHTWSLAVEEQFYILFPFLAFLSGFGRQTKNGARNLFLIMLITSVASIVSFLYLYPINQPAAYFLMPSRFWEIAAGCLTFIIIQERKSIRIWLEKIPPFLIIGTIIGVMYLPLSLAEISTIIVVVLSSILLVSLNSQTLEFKFFTNSNITYIGLISYSLYLWHWGVLSISRWTIGIYWWSVPFQIAAIFFISAKSYEWIEKPLRKNIWFGTRMNTIAIGGGVLFLTTGCLYSLLKPFSGQLYTGTSNLKFNNKFDFPTEMKECNMTPHVLPGKDYKVQPEFNAEFFKKCLLIGNQKKKIILVGDSFAEVQLPGINSIAKDLNLEFGSIYGYGCPYPLVFKKIRYRRSIKCRFVDEEVLAKVLIESLNPGDLLVIRLFLPKNEYIKYPNDIKYVSDAYDFALNDLNNKVKKKMANMLIVGGNPTLNISEFNNLNTQWFNRVPFNRTKKISSISIPKNNRKETQLFFLFDQGLEKLSKNNNWNYFSTRSYFCNQKKCLIKIKEKSLYFDEYHLTQEGMMMYHESLKKNIQKLTK